MADWNIRPRSSQCNNCGKLFAPKIIGHTLLIVSENGYVRQDLCAECYSKQNRTSVQFVSAEWTFTVPAESSRCSQKEDLVQKESAIQLFRKLIIKEVSEYVEVVYILAILLERSKQFVERSVRHLSDGVTVRLYELRATGEVFSVKAPSISLERLPTIQQRVIDLLEGREHLIGEVKLRAKPLRRRQKDWRITPGVKRWKRSR